MRLMEDEMFPLTLGKVKIDRSLTVYCQLHRCFALTSTMFLWALFLIALTASYLSFQSFVDTSSTSRVCVWGGGVGMHGDDMVRLDNFNNYYDPSLKKARQVLMGSHGVFMVEGNINDARLLAKLFDVVPFSHVMHLATQAGMRYAIENLASYIHNNIAGLITLLEACKVADPQPAIVWVLSSSIYGLNKKVPFSEMDCTDSLASLYAATKKAGKESSAAAIGLLQVWVREEGIERKASSGSHA